MIHVEKITFHAEDGFSWGIFDRVRCKEIFSAYYPKMKGGKL